jgi:hypothetical protein
MNSELYITLLKLDRFLGPPHYRHEGSEDLSIKSLAMKINSGSHSGNWGYKEETNQLSIEGTFRDIKYTGNVTVSSDNLAYIIHLDRFDDFKKVHNENRSASHPSSVDETDLTQNSADGIICTLNNFFYKI